MSVPYTKVSMPSTIVQSELMAILELLRNGAIISGVDDYTAKYRQVCLEQAYRRASETLVPALVAYGVVLTDQRLENVIDISAMYQKFLISPSE